MITFQRLGIEAGHTAESMLSSDAEIRTSESQSLCVRTVLLLLLLPFPFPFHLFFLSSQFTCSIVPRPLFAAKSQWTYSLPQAVPCYEPVPARSVISTMSWHVATAPWRTQRSVAS